MILKKRTLKRTSKTSYKTSIKVYDGGAWIYSGYYLFGFIPLYVVRTHLKYVKECDR